MHPDEIQALLNAAPKYLRLWLLFCSDLAIRSGTAGRIGPDNYDRQRRELRFSTKYGAKLTMPVTADIEALINECDMDKDISFVRQLQVRDHTGKGRTMNPNTREATQLDRPYRDLLKQVGIHRHIVPHDLRRTAAVAMLELTHDIRDVQSLLGHRSPQATIWYLDHDLRQISRANLESMKRPYIAWRKDKIA